MKNAKIAYTGDYYEVSILKISKDKFDEYKSNGLPSQAKNPNAWEKLNEKIEAVANGSMVQSEIYKLSIESDGSSIVDLKNNLGKDLNFAILPVSMAVDEESKNYLIQIRIINDAQYYFVIDGEFDLAKLRMEIKPEKLPGGRVVNTLVAKYDGNFFSYKYDFNDIKVYQTYLVDKNGTEFQVSNSEDSVSSFSNPETDDNELTEWFPRDVNPLRVGEYEIELLERAVWPMPAFIYAKWNGSLWLNHFGETVKVKKWRGLKKSS